jgi:hypothetical protein
MAALTASLLIGSALATGYGAIKNSQAQREQADFQADQDKFNSVQSNLQADDAIARGEIDAQNAGTQARQFKGAQKSAIAASGVAVDSGSAADLLAETDKMSTLDILQIKNNAAREAFGYRSQGANYANQADITRRTGKSVAANTLLTGGANAISTIANAATSYSNRKAQSKENS